MFEAKPIHPAPVRSLRESRESGPRLVPVRWSELVAKLDAARDLRAEFASHSADHGASFDPGSAQRIAEICEDKRGINLDDLADGKAGRSISARRYNGAAGDPRI